MPDQLIDLLVIGGGPAGSTLAGLVKKHAPGRRVVLLEKAPGPRHHIGESLLPGIVPVLKELGVYEKVDAAGFPRKIGANYVWGEDRTPWENDFNEVNVSEMLARGGLPPRIEYAWQVRRSAYDEILLSHAESLGVEVRRGVLADGLLEEGERVAGVTLGGEPLRARLVADCSGQNGFLSRHRKVREYDRRLKNVAAYSYFKGARWKYEYAGHPDKTKIFICSVPTGWFWYIPIDGGVVSVGYVTKTDSLKERGETDLEALYLNELAACAEIAPLLEGAERIEDFDGTGQGFFTQSDWSYLNAAASGPGWLAAGDAAVFVDPILSTGVTLAHLGAHRAAYTALAAWREPELGGLLWPDYDRFCRESAAQFLAMALFWYGGDPNARRWWGRAGELQRALLPFGMTDKQAFVTVSAGTTRHFERLLAASDLAEEDATRPEDSPFYMKVLDGGPAAGAIAPGAALSLTAPYKVELTFLPEPGTGRMTPVKRVRFLVAGEDEPARDAVNPRRIVTRHHLALLELIDGRRGSAELSAALKAAGVPAWWADGRAKYFLEELRVQGVLAPQGVAA